MVYIIIWSSNHFFWWYITKNSWLVVEPYPSEKYGFVSWDGWKFPSELENKIHVPNHQPVNDLDTMIRIF